MENLKIREAAKRAGVYLWEIAERYGCCDAHFSRKLRRELPAAEQEKIFAIIEDVAREKKDAV